MSIENPGIVVFQALRRHSESLRSVCLHNQFQATQNHKDAERKRDCVCVREKDRERQRLTCRKTQKDRKRQKVRQRNTETQR